MTIWAIIGTIYRLMKATQMDKLIVDYAISKVKEAAAKKHLLTNADRRAFVHNALMDKGLKDSTANAVLELGVTAYKEFGEPAVEKAEKRLKRYLKKKYKAMGLDRAAAAEKAEEVVSNGRM